MTDARTHLRRRKTPEEHNEETDKCTARQRLLSLLGHPLEKKLEQEKQRKYVLVNEHNRLIQAVRGKEVKLKELQVSLNVLNVQPVTYNNEDTLKQRLRQLENDRERVKKVTTEEKKILVTYHHISEILQQEVSTVNQTLEQEEHAVAIGQVKVDKAIRMLRSAEAAADDTLGKLVEVEYAMLERKRAVELCEGMDLKKEMERFGCLSSKGQSRQTEREEEDTQSLISVEDDQRYDTSAASESNMNLVKDMEPLGYTDVQKLVNKVMSQRDTKEQLTSEKTQCDEQIEQEATVLAGLDLQYSKVKFSEKAAATRFDKLKQTEAKLSQEMKHVERLQATLKQSQHLLNTVEQGINSLYFRMSCVPMEHKQQANVECSDWIMKLMEIRASLPTQLQSASVEMADISGLDQDMFVSLLERFCAMEMRNNKRPSTAPDAPQLSDEEEEGCPTRDEIKRHSMRLIELQQTKKSRKVRML